MKTISTHAAAAKAIREELKKAFPLVKFSVKARSFSGGDSVDIEWKDGPINQSVVSIVGKYQYGHFDGMYDIYEYSNNRNDIPQVKYVQTRRDVSEYILEEIYQWEKSHHVGWESLTGLRASSKELFKNCNFWTASEYIMFHYVQKIDLTNFNMEEFINDRKNEA